MRWWSWIGVVALVAAIGACDESESGGESAASEGAEAKAGDRAEPSADDREGEAEAEDDGASEAGPLVRSEMYELRAEAGAAPYASGKLGNFAITLTGRNEWHVNDEFPFSIKLHAPEGVELPKGELGKDDAAEFGEEKASFDVPFTPAAAGEHRVKADVSFAMCTPETCVPQEQQLAVVLPAE